MADKTKEKVANIFNELADAIEIGQFGNKKKIGLTLLESEHGPEELQKGAEIAEKNNSFLEVEMIGCDEDKCSCLADAHSAMDKMLIDDEIDASVTLHYNFPLGVSTVGRIITPGIGKEMLIATTTGTSDTNRVASMLKSTVYGIATAKSLGIKNPKIGILNVDGARLVENNLRELKDNGYDIEFATSVRSDGGVVMRGNDLLMGVPGVSAEYDQLVGIISRASGAPVIANAIKYMAEVSRGNLLEVTKEEMKKAKKAGLTDLIEELKSKSETKEVEGVKQPEKKVVGEEIAGIDILEIEAAQKLLWKEDIYAETGMGCTGPVVLIAEENKEKAREILKEEGFIH